MICVKSQVDRGRGQLGLYDTKFYFCQYTILFIQQIFIHIESTILGARD